MGRLSFHRRRLWRPWRRLGGRDNALPPGLRAIRGTGGCGNRLDCGSGKGGSAAFHPAPFRNLRSRTQCLHEFRKGTARRLVKKDQVFNRIRVEDIGAALAFLARKNERGIFNVTDDEPCPPQDVVSFAAALMGVEPPPEQAFETADLTPMARSFMARTSAFPMPEYAISASISAFRSTGSPSDNCGKTASGEAEKPHPEKR